MNILLLIFGIVLGGFICYFILKPKLYQNEKINIDIKNENSKLLEINYKLKEEENVLSDKVNKLNILLNDMTIRKQEIFKNVEELEEQANKSSQIIYNKSFELMQEKLSQAAEELSNDYSKMQEKYQQEYLITLKDCGAELAQQLADKLQEIELAQLELNKMRSKVSAAIEAAKREEEKLLELDKYKINLSDLDLLEINRLREIAPYFRNARTIYKIIWESYYRNNTTEMINRILGPGTHSGIYKLTNLTNQKIYIGQSVDLSNRLKEHIKAGLGIDTPNNKLYAAMLKSGVENFSFEIIEKCPKEQLNEKEMYWISFYKSQEFGYNMTKGNN